LTGTRSLQERQRMLKRKRLHNRNKSQEKSWDLFLGMVKTIPRFFCQILFLICTVYTR
jgi:hypothetical protein